MISSFMFVVLLLLGVFVIIFYLKIARSEPPNEFIQAKKHYTEALIDGVVESLDLHGHIANNLFLSLYNEIHQEVEM
ncbi:hypothetical protein Hanom_Chr04g00361651 [Helianthus anomalus]